MERKFLPAEQLLNKLLLYFFFPMMGKNSSKMDLKESEFTKCPASFSPTN